VSETFEHCEHFVHDEVGPLMPAHMICAECAEADLARECKAAGAAKREWNMAVARAEAAESALAREREAREKAERENRALREQIGGSEIAFDPTQAGRHYLVKALEMVRRAEAAEARLREAWPSYVRASKGSRRRCATAGCPYQTQTEDARCWRCRAGRKAHTKETR
jgi:hypothetical protein